MFEFGVKYAITYRILAIRLAIKYGRRFPRAIGIETSTACNRTCYYCPNSTAPFGRQTFMSDTVFEKVLDEIKKIGWFGYVNPIFYNEPFLDPTLVDKVKRIKLAAPKAIVSIYTNGDKLTKESVTELSGLAKIWVTEHPPYSDGWRNRIMRLNDAFPNVIIFRGKIEDADWLVNHGGLSAPKFTPKKSKCTYALNTFQILYNGDVALCCCDAKREYIQGNILTKSIFEIWNQSAVLDIREGALNGKPIIEKCKICLAGNQEVNHRKNAT